MLLSLTSLLHMHLKREAHYGEKEIRGWEMNLLRSPFAVVLLCKYVY